MKALILNCTLKPSPEASSTEALAQVVIDELKKGGAETELVRLVDLNLKPGVKTDQGEGDDWPAVHEKIMAANIVVFATPTWVGQMSSVCMRALERMDALFEEMDTTAAPSPSERSAASSSPATRTAPTTSSRPCLRP